MSPDNERRISGPVEIGAVLQALRSQTRREILALVWDRELAAGDIAATFPLSAATISEHLATLRAAGLVRMAKAGTSRRYRAVPEALTGMHGVLESTRKWQPVEYVPERTLATASTHPMVVATVEVNAAPEATFAALTDAEIYSRWLGSPVTIDNGRFAATLEWGIEVRGRYEIVVPPELIVLSWDFDNGNIPVPGRPLTGYVRVAPHGDGTSVTVHQLVDSPEQAAFMEGAWRMVLGRLRANIRSPLDRAPVSDSASA